MKTKITIISPVHIGTGDERFSFEYTKKNNVMYNYDLQQLLSSILDKTLLNYRFLNSLYNAKNNDSKRDEMNRVLRNQINYTKIKPQYQLRADFDNEQVKNIAVQIKSLNKPYIPGSSLKGAVMNAIYYDFVKNHFREFCKYIEIKSNKNQEKKVKVSISDFIQNFYRNEYDKKKVNFFDFLNLFANCFMFSDVYFDNMVLVNAHRDKVYKDEKEVNLSLPDFECIDANQEIIGQVIKIDTAKKKNLEVQYSQYKFYNDLSEYINYNKLIIVCRQYFKDMIDEENQMEDMNNYYNMSCIKKLYEERATNSFYMRIGKNTNYFFKTISYLVKKQNYSLYEKYFDKVFSPINKPKSKNSPKPHLMPSTRTNYFDDSYSYYPGVIKIEFIK